MEISKGVFSRGNASFLQRYGHKLRTKGSDWVDILELANKEEAIKWLASADSASQPYVGKVATEVGSEPQWLRLRRMGPDPATNPNLAWIELEDVSEPYASLERTRMEGQHFHALIERSAEGISLFDLNAKILYECPSNKRIHGYEHWELEGKYLFDFCHEDDIPRVLPRFESLAKAPGVVETEVVRFKHRNGHWIYLEGTVINATDDPRVGALVNNFRDVTARLDAEREIRRSKHAAEEAQRLQQHFLANLSHEFKTPLTLIRGPLLDLAEGRTDPATMPATLCRVLKNVDRLNGLITELVDLSRLDAGTFGLKVTQHDLVALARQELDNFSSAAESKGLQLNLDSPTSCIIFFDLTKMEKVLGNLLSNALRYSPEKGVVTVRIHLQANAEDGLVRVDVQDQGPGMDEATQTRVFDRFYQADTTLTRTHEGMGIGLALAKEMVEMHGGQIGVDSQINQGSTFWFTLPLGCAHFDPDDIDTGAAREPRPHTIGSHAAPAQFVSPVEKAAHRPRLLLVEDNEDMRTYLRLNLDPYYTVTEAINGEQILKVVENARPELILSDVMMPHVDGLELCRELKASANYRSIPILLLSAKGSADHRVEGLRAGADDYMAKPFSVAELLQRLYSRVPWGSDTECEARGWKARLESIIDTELSSVEFDVARLALLCGYSQRQLLRRITQSYGMKPSEFILKRRLERAHAIIGKDDAQTVAEIAHAVGLSPGYFSRRYRSIYGVDSLRKPTG